MRRHAPRAGGDGAHRAAGRGGYLFVLDQTGRPVEFAAPAGSVALAGGERLGTDDAAVLGLKSPP